MPTATAKKSAKRSRQAKKGAVSEPLVAVSTRSSGNFLDRSTYRMKAFLARRPHRSFRRTYRRDYVRSLQLPGYWAFTAQVWRSLWRERKLFGLLAATYAVLSGLLVGIASQDVYTQLGDTLNQTSGNLFQGSWSAVSKAGLLFTTAISGGLNTTPTEGQQVYGALISLMTWLTTVWLLRNILAGQKVRLRDGLYSSGAPILSTFLVGLVVLVQLLPLALALIGYSAAQSSGLLAGGVEAMLFWAAAGLLALLSVYWATSTIIALVVVTLPGMYPYQAIKTAGDLVIGRRTRILMRLLWSIVITLIIWAIIMIPIILLDGWLKSVWSASASVPVVPVMLLIMSSLTVIWLASYVYLLYRKVVEDDAQPA
jgi:hypothetical protein